MLSHSYIAVFWVLTSLAAAGCGWFPSDRNLRLSEDVPGLPPQSESGKLNLPPSELPPVTPDQDKIQLSSGDFIPLRHFRGRTLIPVEGLIAADGFGRMQANAALLNLSPAEKQAEFLGFAKSIVSKIDAHVPLQDVYYAAEVGYFTGWVSVNDYPLLKNVQGIPLNVLVSPLVQSQSHPHSVSTELPIPPLMHSQFKDFSGTERMGVSEFLNQAKTEIGSAPNGSRVRVGVTDTGVTYAHPAFLDSETGKSRVEYMKDFTTEGVGFVTSDAKIKAERSLTSRARRSSQMIPVTISAEYLEPDFMDAFVNGENAEFKFGTITEEVFLLPKQLVELLELPDTPVRLGVIQEQAFATKEDQADINGNGKTDDEFYFFHVSASGRRVEKVWIDFSGTGNFRASQRLRDFNKSGDFQEVVSEKIGVSFENTELKSAGFDTQPKQVTRVSLVGFDPGNHGSHVAGIIGANSTLTNTPEGMIARGVAPGSRLMMNRVCSNNGGCNATRAMIDLAQNGAKVINMSLGGLSSENDGYSVQETIINRLTELYDVLFVISAGNSGPGRQTVGSPSTARHALSVAATATPAMILSQYNWLPFLPGSVAPAKMNDDFVMYFSSRGPSAAGGFKPNISAPGTQLSTVQLNAAPGFRAGLDVYWGTSMAAPAAAGAAALLIDAAMAMNEKYPQANLPTDSLTIRRVLLDSAQAFRVTSFNPRTGETQKGIYTWIDQGYGMVSLPNAWRLLKEKAAVRLHSGVTSSGAETNPQSARLNYVPMVLRTMPNGINYNGQRSFQSVDENNAMSSVRKIGQGLWLSESETDSVFEVHFSRTLNLKDKSSPEVGRLLRELNTSAETFELETVFYGSHIQWLKVGVPQTAQCEDSSIPELNSLTLIGSGAIENPIEEQTSAAITPLRASSLFICLKKAEFDRLPPGDHGAIIRAYKVSEGVRDAVASFEIPVYVTVPHHSTALQAQFVQRGEVGSFMVNRHYVRVPAGVSVLEVSAEVAEKAVDAPCSSVRLMVLAGSNTSEPSGLEGSSALAQNCSTNGTPSSKNLEARLSQLNPKAGIWDLHVFGRFQFPLSSYTLKIDYATFEDIAPINATAKSIASGELQVRLKESTFDAAPEASKSTIKLTSWLGRTHHETSAASEVTAIPSAAGEMARVYGPDAAEVTITTTSVVPGLDIDLFVDSCLDAQLKECERVAQSGNAAAEESVTFQPITGRFYAVRIDPYDVPVQLSRFSVTELISTSAAEQGELSMLPSSESNRVFDFKYQFETRQSKLLTGALYMSGKYEVAGECTLLNAAGVTLAKIPVHVLSE